MNEDENTTYQNVRGSRSSDEMEFQSHFCQPDAFWESSNARSKMAANRRLMKELEERDLQLWNGKLP